MHYTLLFIYLCMFASNIFCADDQRTHAVKLYEASQFKEAIPCLIDDLSHDIDIEQNRIRLTFAQAACAIDTKKEKGLRSLIGYIVYNPAIKMVALAGEGFGDTIMFSKFLKRVNRLFKNSQWPEVSLYLQDSQAILAPILQRADVATSIITDDDISFQTYTKVVPLHRFVSPRFFSDAAYQKPYLQPREDAIDFWCARIDPSKLNIVTKWRSGTKAVFGDKRILHRDLPLRVIIDIARAVDENAHVYLIQSKPHHTIILQSMFNQMNNDDKQNNALNVIPDEYMHYVTQVSFPDGSDPHGPLEDTLALLSLLPYVGSDTNTAHMSGNVEGGKTIMIIPSRNADGTSNRDWRWGQGNPQLSQTSGETTPWYNSNRFRIFEINPHNAQEIAPVIKLLGQWRAKYRSME